MLYWGATAPLFFMKRILLSPITHFNVMIMGLLILIGMIHNNYHHAMDKDVHGYVRKFCFKNPDKCRNFIDGEY